MRKRLFQYIFRLEYLIASLLVMGMVQMFIVLSDSLPEADETSFLNPILGRIEYLNITDISLDAIFAVKDAEFADSRVKVVNVGEIAPTPDGMIALLIRKLHALGARVIGIDIIFDEQHFERFPAERQEEIDALISALHDVPGVVVANGFDAASGKPAFTLDPRVRASPARYGFANLIPDPDGVVRRFLPRTEVEGNQWLSLPVEMLSVAEHAAIAPLLQLPAEPQIIYYTGTFFQFECAPIEDVVFGSMYDGDYFKDAIVLVGFVNEGGLFYLGDTHKTPMGKKIGIEGPDMPGVIIHANVINMLLKGTFISPIPVWGDWLLVFLLTYLSIAVYRVLRTKPASNLQVGLLITSMLITQGIVIFFLPLIAFFYFDIKISYNLMATAALLYIPVSALTTRARFMLLQRRIGKGFADSRNPLPDVLSHAFEDEAPYPAHVRLVHSCAVHVQFAWALHAAEARESGQGLTAVDLLPGIAAWRLRIPEIAAICDPANAREAEMRYFIRFLAGKKDEQLRDSLMRETFFSTELSGFNEFVSFEEWELMLPYAQRLWRTVLRSNLEIPLAARQEDGAVVGLPRCDAGAVESATSHLVELAPGVFRIPSSPSSVLTRLSPLCEWTECKLHRQQELFVFAGLLRKQRGMPRVPAYLGPTPNCEPALPEWSIRELREIEMNAKTIERSA